MNKENKMKQLLHHLKEIAEINSGGDWDFTVHQAEWKYIEKTITEVLGE